MCLDSLSVSLLNALCEQEGSDLHLAHGMAPRFRLHGELCTLPAFDENLSAGQIEGLVQSLVAEPEWNALCETNELDAAFSGEDGTRFRLNAYRQQAQLAVAIRRLPKRFFELDQLSLSPVLWRKIIGLPSGLVVVAGSTGSGKTTTIASLLNAINEQRACHIHTIENPIEYQHRSRKSLVTQREVGSDTASFAEALRRSLRQDPDVVMVGEMRDLETMRAALTLAETGHLTFATLHTADAVQTVSRIIGAFPAGEQALVREQLAGCLRAVICQQLIPGRQGNGRSLAAEVLWVTACNQALIREAKTHQIQSTIQTGGKHGMQTHSQSLVALVRQRKIDVATALRYSTEKHRLREELINQGLCRRNEKFNGVV